MTTMSRSSAFDPTGHPTLRLDLGWEADVSTARLVARALGRGLELGDGTATRFATAVSEVCRNAVIHATGGAITFHLDEHGRQASLVGTIEDRGPGIDDVDAAMTRGASDPARGGVGLSRARRLVDDLRIAPREGGGTVVQLVRSLPPGAGERWATALLDVAPATRSRPGAEAGAIPAEVLQLRLERERLARELEETNRGVVALYAELEDQAEQLRRADELKSRFLSRVSHELRTPINSIVALSRLLADRVDGELSEGQATQVGFIQAAASELSGLVNDLLDLARIESGRVDVEPHEFLLESTFVGMRGTLHPLAKPGVELRFEPATSIPPLFTDEGKLTQIVRNFVSNALKFTDRGAVTIRASFDAARGHLRIEVADTGIGIAPEDLERIFEEFVQVPGAHQIGIKGTGLGLSVARGLAAVLGGEAGARSVLGQGSTFWVEVPAIHAAPERDATLPVDGVASPTVLVVDDDPTARYLVRHQLAAEGVRILEAGTGEDGLRLAAERRPDAIVLDLSLPDLDGLEVLGRLRADAATEDRPVVVHSGRRLSADERRTIELGRASLVPKDSSPGSVAGAVRRMLGAAPVDRSAGEGTA